MNYSPSQIYGISYFINFLILIKRLKEKNVIKRNGTFPEKENMENVKNGYYAHMVSALKKYIQFYFPDADIKKERTGLRFKLFIKLQEGQKIEDNPVFYKYFLQTMCRQHGGNVTFNAGLLNVHIRKPQVRILTDLKIEALIKVDDRNIIGDMNIADSVDAMAEEMTEAYNPDLQNDTLIKDSIDNNFSYCIDRMASYSWIAVTAPEFRKKEKKSIEQFEGLGVSKFDFTADMLQDLETEETRCEMVEKFDTPMIVTTVTFEEIRRNNDEAYFNDFHNYYHDLIDSGQNTEMALALAKGFYPNLINAENITTEMMEIET